MTVREMEQLLMYLKSNYPTFQVDAEISPEMWCLSFQKENGDEVLDAAIELVRTWEGNFPPTASDLHRIIRQKQARQVNKALLPTPEQTGGMEEYTVEFEEKGQTIQRHYVRAPRSFRESYIKSVESKRNSSCKSKGDVLRGEKENK